MADLPGEGASLSELLAVEEGQRENLSKAQRGLITEAEAHAATRVTVERERLTAERVTADAATAEQNKASATTQQNLDYYKDWRGKLHSDSGGDVEAFRAEMANPDNERRYNAGGVAVAATVSAPREREIAEKAVLDNFQGWHVAMENLGHGDVFPAAGDTAAWKRIQALPGGAPAHIWDAAFEAGKEAGRSETVAELGSDGRPSMGNAAPAGGNGLGDIDLSKPGAGLELFDRAAALGSKR